MGNGMPSVSLDQFLAAVLLAFLLLMTVPATLADPTGATIDGAKRAQETRSSLAGIGSEHTTAQPKPSLPTMAPTELTISDEFTEQRSDAPSTLAAPTSTPNPNQPLAEGDRRTVGLPPASAAQPMQTYPQSTAGPEIPAATAVLPGSSEPATAATEDAIPTTPVVVPPAAPIESETIPGPTTVVDVDAPIAEQLRNLAIGKFDRIIGNKKDKASIEAFYAARNYAPVWITDASANARSAAAIAYLGRVDADGLDPADYPVPNFASLSDPAALAEAEVRLTTSVVAYAHHAQIGRIHWSRVSADIFYDTTAPEPAAVLANIVEAKDVSEALASYEPHTAEYRALKAKLAEIRAGKGSTGKPQIPHGPPLNIGMQDQRVPLLRLRLGVPGETGAIYDRGLADAVKRFQQTHAIGASGILNTATVEALNGRQSDPNADIILANMERWRWMPHDLGKVYVIVNLPDYTLRVMQQGKQVWMARIIAGKPATPTPIISAQMKSITVNPTWNVPASIVNNEYLPLAQQDPTILQRMGLIVSYNADGTIHISQPPGEQNALGRLRFNFPNKFLVYQHDSNQKSLFANEKRAESHGCMRVQDPLKYAEVLLSLVRPAGGYSQDRIRAMFSSNEIDIPFPTFMPVHVTYQTAFVNDHGQLELREDVYHHDQALFAVAKGPERKVADIPIDRKDNMMRRQLLAIPDNSSGNQGSQRAGVYAGGANIFTRLFGYPYTQQAPVQRRSAMQPRPYGQ
jgi:L,D-transpeptidase YcbB